MTKRFSKELFSEVVEKLEGNKTRNATCDCHWNDSKKQLVLHFKDEILERKDGYSTSTVQVFDPMNWALTIGAPMARYNEKKCQDIFNSLDANRIKDFYLLNRSAEYRFNDIASCQEIWKMLP